MKNLNYSNKINIQYKIKCIQLLVYYKHFSNINNINTLFIKGKKFFNSLLCE